MTTISTWRRTTTTWTTPEPFRPPRRVPGPGRFCLGLGTNVGPGEQTLRRAIAALSAALGALAVGPLLRSLALAGDGSPLAARPYLNTVVLGFTPLPPDAVLAVAKRIEQLAGRRRGPRDASRPLDVDLLLYDDRISHHPELTLPHPRLARRRFVLLPLAELAPELTLPPADTPIPELLARVGQEDQVERLVWAPPPPGSSSP